MKNFDLKKYLAEGRLFEAQKYDMEAVLRDIREFNQEDCGHT